MSRSIFPSVNIPEAVNRASPFFSFLIGLGLAVIFFHRKFDVARVLALPVDKVTEKVVKADGKCYKYSVEDATCEIPSSK